MFSATSAMSCYYDPKAEGSNSADDSSTSKPPLNATDSGASQKGCGDDDDPVELPVQRVYGYMSSFGGFGGMVGINFALSIIVGGSGYIASSNTGVGCSASADSLDWANRAFQRYREQYRDEYNVTGVGFAVAHQTGSEWTVEFPDGSVGVYEIANPIGNTSINTAPVSCN